MLGALSVVAHLLMAAKSWGLAHLREGLINSFFSGSENIVPEV